MAFPMHNADFYDLAAPLARQDQQHKREEEDERQNQRRELLYRGRGC